MKIHIILLLLWIAFNTSGCTVINGLNTKIADFGRDRPAWKMHKAGMDYDRARNDFILHQIETRYNLGY